MASKIINKFLMAVTIDGYGFRMIGSFSSGELAMRGLEEFKERHQMPGWTDESEPARCKVYLYVLQPDKTYLNAHAPQKGFDPFHIDLGKHPEAWHPNYVIAKALSEASS